jgi:hypothetical protein
MGLSHSSLPSAVPALLVATILSVPGLNRLTVVAWAQEPAATANARFDTVIKVTGTLKSANRNSITVARPTARR